MVQIATRPSTPLARKNISICHKGGMGERSPPTAQLARDTAPFLENANGADGVLVDRLQLGVFLDVALEIHLSEHVKSGVLASDTNRALVMFD